MEGAGAVVRTILPMHARSHRLSGSDPLEVDIPFIQAAAQSGVTITADTEFDAGASGVSTNDRKAFCWDPSDRPGLLIKKSGSYLVMASTGVNSGDVAVERRILVKIGLMSDGPFPGGDFGAADFTAGDTFVDATTGSKSVLWLIAHQTLTVGDATDPYRVSMIFDHQGTNYTVAARALRVYRMGTDALGVPPLPPT